MSRQAYLRRIKMSRKEREIKSIEMIANAIVNEMYRNNKEEF